MFRRSKSALLLAVALACPSFAAPTRDKAADFPPGVFSDGGRYSTADFEGKLLVLFFYEKDCPSCRNLIPDRNAVIEKFRDKPVKFIAIAPEDKLAEAQAYVRETKLAMPVFADTLGLMQERYGQKISLRNIYQFRIIGPDGSIVGMSMTDNEINEALALTHVDWKYKNDGYDAKLAGPIELLEWNQFEAGLKALRPYLKKKDAVGESAQKLYEAVKTEAAAWAEEAKAAGPVRAYDLNVRLANCLPDEELGKTAAEEAKRLKAEKPVKDELAARRALDGLTVALAKASLTDRAAFANQCRALAKKYADTPTGTKAAAVADEIDALAKSST